jgi:hypothetical protein
LETGENKTEDENREMGRKFDIRKVIKRIINNLKLKH